MSEGKGTNFFDKLKTDKKFRFEFIMRYGLVSWGLPS